MKAKVTQSWLTLRSYGLYSPSNSPGQNTGVGSLFPSPRDLPNTAIKPRSPTLQTDSLPAEPPASPRRLEWVAYPFSSRSSRPRSRTRVSCIAGGFFTNWTTRKAQFVWVRFFSRQVSIQYGKSYFNKLFLGCFCIYTEITILVQGVLFCYIFSLLSYLYILTDRRQNQDPQEKEMEKNKMAA